MSGKEKILMKSEEKRSLTELASFFRDLADKIERNQLTLKQGEEEYTLHLPDPVTLELELEDKMKKGRTKRQLEIEIEWYPGEEDSSIKLG